MFENVCAPALVYMAFSLSGVAVDAFAGSYGAATSKMLVAGIITVLLSALCQRGFAIVAWLIVLIPFALMTLIIAMLVFVLGVDPGGGQFQMVDSGTIVNKV